MKKLSTLLRILAIFAGVLVFFSCMEEDDMRQKTLDDLGEPDEIQTGGWGSEKYEIYFYDRKDLNRAYIYEKSAPGCGSGGNWYIMDVVYPADIYYARELYEPPTIVHAPVKTAPPDAELTVKAKITDDSYVKDAILYYQAKGDSTFIPVNMAPGDSSYYFAEIPREYMKISGVEYFIYATDSGHASRLPQVKGTYSVIVSQGASVTYGKQQTIPKAVPPISGSITGKKTPVAP